MSTAPLGGRLCWATGSYLICLDCTSDTIRWALPKWWLWEKPSCRTATSVPSVTRAQRESCVGRPAQGRDPILALLGLYLSPPEVERHQTLAPLALALQLSTRLCWDNIAAMYTFKVEGAQPLPRITEQWTSSLLCPLHQKSCHLFLYCRLVDGALAIKMVCWTALAQLLNNGSGPSTAKPTAGGVVDLGAKAVTPAARADLSWQGVAQLVEQREPSSPCTWLNLESLEHLPWSFSQARTREPDLALSVYCDSCRGYLKRLLEMFRAKARPSSGWRQAWQGLSSMLYIIQGSPNLTRAGPQMVAGI